VQQLESAGIPHRIAATSPSLDGLWAALQGGLGITARTAMQLPPHLVADRSLHRLPALPALPVALHRGPDIANPALDTFHSLLSTATRNALAELMHPQRPRILRKA
jgi:hypothetical protein